MFSTTIFTYIYYIYNLLLKVSILSIYKNLTKFYSIESKRISEIGCI